MNISVTERSSDQVSVAIPIPMWHVLDTSSSSSAPVVSQASSSFSSSSPSTDEIVASRFDINSHSQDERTYGSDASTTHPSHAHTVAGSRTIKRTSSAPPQSYPDRSHSLQPLSPPSSQHSRVPPAGGGWVPTALYGNGADLRSELCFSYTEGKVTSLAASQDGAYVVAGFSSGVVRLYDMTLSGNGDPDDRYGHIIGKIAGTMHVHVEIGGTDASFGSVGGKRLGCSHIFAGPRIGCTTMLVVDLEAMRRMKRRRGFITTGGSALKACSHSHSRLRGFSSLSLVDYQGHEDGGYTARYRVVCGMGFNTYNIWDVTIHTAMDASLELQYTSDWAVVATGSAGGPLVFAHIVTSNASRVIASLTADFGDAVPSSEQQGVAGECMEVSSSSTGGLIDPPILSYELVYRSRENFLRVQRLVKDVFQCRLFCMIRLH